MDTEKNKSTINQVTDIDLLNELLSRRPLQDAPSATTRYGKWVSAHIGIGSDHTAEIVMPEESYLEFLKMIAQNQQTDTEAKKRYRAFKTGVMDSVNLRPIEETLKFPYDEKLWGDYQAGYQQGFKIRQQISEMAEQYAGHKEPVVKPFSDLQEAINKARGGEAQPQHQGFA